ncbi:MAG: hypothetical protein LLF86_02500 [Nitrospiraceae bacterium]|nr:hypothetical protein [Nitrospiraceae bacterium]
MELHREIRALYVKLSTPADQVGRDTIENIWNLSNELLITSVDLTSEAELIIHADIAFSLKHWNDTVNFLRDAMNSTSAKSGFIIIRKVMGSAEKLSTEIETYKVTKRGVYNSDSPESPDFIEDVIRYSGSNKRLQQIDAMDNLFRFIEEKENDESSEESR